MAGYLDPDSGKWVEDPAERSVEVGDDGLVRSSGADALNTMVQGDHPGIVEKGNLDLTRRPQVKNDDGSVSTVRSMSFSDTRGGPEILVPTVSHDGKRILNDDEAIAQYKNSGRHLGKFKTPADADAYAQKLHQQQESFYKLGDNQRQVNVGDDGLVRPAAPPPVTPSPLSAPLSSIEKAKLIQFVSSGKGSPAAIGAARSMLANSPSLRAPKPAPDPVAPAAPAPVAPVRDATPNLSPAQRAVMLRAQRQQQPPGPLAMNGAS